MLVVAAAALIRELEAQVVLEVVELAVILMFLAQMEPLIQAAAAAVLGLMVAHQAMVAPVLSSLAILVYKNLRAAP
jgi:predicted anti-sigma-YlaC factor YlaD